MIPCALVVMLFFNDAVLRPGRWPYIVDWNAYARAVALRDERTKRAAARAATKASGRSLPRTRSVRLDPHPDPHSPGCPAYDTNAAAFFASLDGTHAGASLRRRAGAMTTGTRRCVLPAVREDRGRFAALRDARVLIYWPHGFGDWVHFGASCRCSSRPTPMRSRASATITSA